MARITESIICITFVRFLLLLLNSPKNHEIGFVNSLSEINDFTEIDDRSPLASLETFGRLESGRWLLCSVSTTL
ncbi:hypothetical protein AMJ87_07615 [candidate division WOR_3 bacterium SM23_60]|uniref:Uncharacterized protein n=1 Tax=candidate division WOR_3 bacterium SM23_60 TaxID=1703780 RepID=A0A0S8GHP3_UNCW3|nr:MAG: hypothetical protein AMJ87_07615 [candidate division WOR_3 bacterium SM23_60]